MLRKLDHRIEKSTVQFFLAHFFDDVLNKNSIDWVEKRFLEYVERFYNPDKMRSSYMKILAHFMYEYPVKPVSYRRSDKLKFGRNHVHQLYQLIRQKHLDNIVYVNPQHGIRTSIFSTINFNNMTDNDDDVLESCYL